MSTPQQIPKGPRRAGRKSKGNQMPNGSNPLAVMSDNEATRYHEAASGNEFHAQQNQGRRKSHANNRPSTAPRNGYVSDNNNNLEKTRATPIKQAYAGPTFHQSPAASALPMPSFYSRSVPNVAAQPPNPIPEHPTEQETITPPQERTPTKRESTPLDFLFDAARQARGTPRGESPGTRSGNHSVAARSPAANSPAPRDPESMFPFELEGQSTPGEDGTPFAANYRDRMDSLNSTRSISDGVRGMDEMERRAKTDALKKFLMRSPPPLGASPVVDPNNPFNARPAQPRQHSGSPTPPQPQNYQHAGRTEQYFQNPNITSPGGPGYSNRQGSNLRNVYEATTEPEPAELSSDNALSPPRISTARRQIDHSSQQIHPGFIHQFSPPPNNQAQAPMYNQFGPPHPNQNQAPLYNHFSPPPMPQPSPNPPVHRSKPSAQQLEDDLRRVLNLNVISKV